MLYLLFENLPISYFDELSMEEISAFYLFHYLTEYENIKNEFPDLKVFNLKCFAKIIYKLLKFFKAILNK